MVKKESLIAGIIVASSIILIVYLLSLFGVEQGWPAFFVVFFYMLGGDRNKKKMLKIFVGGATGILISYVVSQCIHLMAHTLGGIHATLIVIFITIFIIIIMGDLIQLVFNDYTFIYFMVASAMPQPQQPLILAATLMLGGAAFAVMVIGLHNIFLPFTTDKTKAIL